jgi:predicted metal-dependent phosphoesterase TrpH
MSPYRADLHCHSTYSDGTLTPIELLHLAKEKGLSAICITDHDSLDAYTDETFEEAQRVGIILYVGVEFSSRHMGQNIHVLGYGVEITPTLLEFCEKHKERRRERNRAMLEHLKKLSFPIEEEELYRGRESSSVGRSHIADLMVQKGYVRSIKEGFNRYLGDGKCCYEEGRYFSVEETIDQIHRSKGKAFLAHPHLIRKKEVLRAVLEMNFDGIECYYCLFHANQEKRWLSLVEEKGMLKSGGSDFHGAVTPHVPLGCSWVDQSTAEAIFR